MTCTRCGSDEHTLAHCPWPFITTGETMKYIALITLAALAGCGSITSGIGAQMENRIACTAAKDKLFVVSLYGPVGISSTIAEADRAVICGAAPAK